MNNTYCLEKYEDVLALIEKHYDDFSNQYSYYVNAFDTMNIKMEISPCYFYNMKFKMKKRQKGCCMFYRIRLFPKFFSFKHAQKKHLAKEIFSHKIIDFTKVSVGYKVKTNFNDDKILKTFLKNLLDRTIILNNSSKQGYMALKESICDVFRSFVLMHRYRSEVKTDFYGFDLHWIILLIAIILIILKTDAYWDYLFSLGDY